jgi:DNA-directed RNA polymerase subunit M/transcription elongation factor TFIIS
MKSLTKTQVFKALHDRMDEDAIIELLDGLVHSNTNNAGIEEQIKFLFDQWGKEGTNKTLEDVLNQAPKTDDASKLTCSSCSAQMRLVTDIRVIEQYDAAFSSHVYGIRSVKRDEVGTPEIYLLCPECQNREEMPEGTGAEIGRPSHPGDDCFPCPRCGSEDIVYSESCLNWRDVREVEDPRDGEVILCVGPDNFGTESGDDEHLRCNSCDYQYEVPSDRELHFD